MTLLPVGTPGAGRQPAHGQVQLLVVDDEPHIRSALTRALALEGYSVEAAATGQKALELLQRMSYQLLVLDLRLPDMDGVEVMRRAHEISPGLLVIILTGHATLESAIEAVKSKDVVDYLLKPARVHQVAAAVKTALERYAEQKMRDRLVQTISEAVHTLSTQRTLSRLLPGSEPISQILVTPPLRLDCQTRRVTWEDDSGRAVELTHGEMAVLAYLMARPGQVCSCGELARAVWGHDLADIDAERPIRSYIFRLRQKIEPNPGEPQLIQTVRGGGYLLNPGPSDSKSPV